MVSTKSPNKGRAPPKTTPYIYFFDGYKTELQIWKQKQSKQPEKKITKQNRQDKKNRIKNIKKEMNSAKDPTHCVCTLKKRGGEIHPQPTKMPKTKTKYRWLGGKKATDEKNGHLRWKKKEAEKSRRRLKEERHARRPFSAYIEKKGECNMNAA